MDKILYEKKYPKFDIEEWENTAKDTEETVSEIPPVKEFFAKLRESTSYVPIPERIALKEVFIETAIAVGELYEFDTTIYDHGSHISVWFSMDYGGGSIGALRQVFLLSDDYDFLTGIDGRNITITCDYYTHEVWYNGRKTAPIQWDLFEDA